MRFIKMIIIVALFFFGLLFFTQNKEALSAGLTLRFDLFLKGLEWTGQSVPFYFVTLLSFAVGMLFATLFFLLDRVKLTGTIIQKKHAIRVLQDDVKRLTTKLTQESTILESLRTQLEAEVQKHTGLSTGLVATAPQTFFAKPSSFRFFKKNTPPTVELPTVCEPVANENIAEDQAVSEVVKENTEKTGFSLFGRKKS